MHGSTPHPVDVSHRCWSVHRRRPISLALAGLLIALTGATVAIWAGTAGFVQDVTTTGIPTYSPRPLRLVLLVVAGVLLLLAGAGLTIAAVRQWFHGRASR